MVQVEVGEEDVEAGRLGREGEAEVADPGAGVEDEERAVGEGDADAGGVAAVADRLRAGGGDRAAGPPEVDLHGRPRSWRRCLRRGGARASTASAGNSSSTGQKIAIAALRPVRGEDREGRAFDLVDLAVEGADAEAGVGGTAAAHRAHHRQLLVGDRLAGLVVGAEEAAPLARPDVPDLVEALAEQPPRRLVVEDEQAALVDQEGRGREGRHQVPGKDQLERLLRHG